MERGWWHLEEAGPHEEDWRDPQLFRVLATRGPAGVLPEGARGALSIFGVALTEILPHYLDDTPRGEEGRPAGTAGIPREHARP
jgi:hypothetical protein